jgi:regulatory protein
MRWLAARDRSAHEIAHRLTAAGVRPATVARTLQRLRERGYLDDARLADSAAAAAVRRRLGSVRVRADLEARGVAESCIVAALSAHFDDEVTLARAALAQHRLSTPDDPRQRAQAARWLLQRGFPEPVVLAIVGEGC